MKKAMRQSDVIVRMLALTQKKGRSLVVFKKKGEIESDLSFVWTSLVTVQSTKWEAQSRNGRSVVSASLQLHGL